MKILIADDEAFFRGLLKELLEKAGHKVVGAAKDGTEAVEMAQELRPDIVFLDVVMPRMNGLEAAKKLCSLGLHLQVIMLSSVGHGAVVAEAMSAGASAYIKKPPREEEILEIIKVVEHAGDSKQGA